MLLIANFVIAFAVCLVIVNIFRPSIAKILQRLVAEDIYTAWVKYIVFAAYVVGISGGVRVWDLEKYISPTTCASPTGEKIGEVLALTSERWILETYRTLIGTLQSIAGMLLAFFIFALVAYVIVKGLEMRKQNKA